jgi:hypothetical protein
MEKMMTVENLAEDVINCQNLRYSRSWPRPAIALAAEDNIMMEVVVLYENGIKDRVWRLKRANVYQWNLFQREAGPGSL